MKVEVSIGEVVDKLTILSIKLEKFKDEQKRENVKKEYDILARDLKSFDIDETSPEFIKLKEVNLRLWNIEDNIRVKEKNREFDDVFIKLARSVYVENDNRANAKKEINIKFGSDLVEEKEYCDYK